MKKKHKRDIHNAAEIQVDIGVPAPDPAQCGTVHVGDLVIRRPITISTEKVPKPVRGVVIYVHPLGRYHVVEFGRKPNAVRESFMGVQA